MRFSIALAAMISVAPGAVLADDWTYAATIYGWLPGLSGSIATARGDIDFDSSGSDIIDNLDMAFMGTFEAWNGRWGLIGDLLYADVSNQKPTPFGALFASADVGVKIATFSGYGAYRVVDEPDVTFDLAAGFRAYGMDIETTLNAGTLPTETSSTSESWVDPLIGARASWRFSDRWSATAFADIGGFGIGSDLTWQALATVNYHFNDKWSAMMGYRYLEIDKPVNGRDTKIGLGGPVLGVTLRF